MISYSDKLTKGVWVQISNDEPYIMQNKTKDGSIVLVKASAAEPTSTSATHELGGGEVMASTILSGVIWATALNGDCLVTYSK